MILVDTGPFVALFDPQDALHERCKNVLRKIREPLCTTVPVLTEAFHMLSPASFGANRLRDFVIEGGVQVWFMDRAGIQRAFFLMERYADHPMDLADASLVVAAEVLRTSKIFTIDRQDFETYRLQRGHRYYPFEIVN
ncbi:MAG: PIN domain-containing protein [Deltaproteobacteria bacterium]|nr:PIN domain-containing protein [Deltaproteobacteria bacterium]